MGVVSDKYKEKDLPGIVNGIELTAVNNYVEEKFHGESGHGFAAESANNLYDKLTGNDDGITGSRQVWTRQRLVQQQLLHHGEG